MEPVIDLHRVCAADPAFTESADIDDVLPDRGSGERGNGVLPVDGCKQ